ncbi:MAG TPA: hypothetical protein P5089_01125 [Candidatus Portnoybacteria bacterium]|nr:hypothetical protein [Candidatus Portnoybacteria bacterium]
MSKKNIELEYSWKYSEVWPYNGMVNDLYRGVQAEQNYLVALGLFAYSEALGRMILGTIGRRGGGAKAFRAFTEKYVGYKFVNWDEVFDLYRNGFVHEFYIKKIGSGVYNDDGLAKCGLVISGSVLHVLINSYFKHFAVGLERAIDAGVLQKQTL